MIRKASSDCGWLMRRPAGTPDAEENEEAEPTLEDDTPAGQWVRGVRKVYENITDRCDVEKWKALFEADDFLSLEEEENCTTYLLRFLMEHYKLPTAIWKLLDEKIHIVQNAGAFRERFPAQFVSYMVHKCESGEEVDFSEFRGAKMRITISFCNIMTELIRRCRRKNYRKRSR